MSAATSVYKLTIRKKVLFGSFWKLALVSLVLLNVQCRCQQGLIDENRFVLSKKRLTTGLPSETDKTIDGSNIVTPMESAIYQQQEVIAITNLPLETGKGIGKSADQQQGKSSDSALLPKSDDVIEVPVIRLLPKASKETDGTVNQQQEEIPDPVSLPKLNDVTKGSVIDLLPETEKITDKSVDQKRKENPPDQIRGIANSHTCGGGFFMHPNAVLNTLFGFRKR